MMLSLSSMPRGDSCESLAPSQGSRSSQDFSPSSSHVSADRRSAKKSTSFLLAGAMLGLLTCTALLCFARSRPQDNSTTAEPTKLANSMVSVGTTSTTTSLIYFAAPLPTSVAEEKKTGDFGDVLKCVGEGSPKLTLQTKLGDCAKDLLEDSLAWLGHEWKGYSIVNPEKQQMSLIRARPLYSVAMAKACSSMCQASQCGPQDFMREWTCPDCKAAGFELELGTHRFVHYEELGRPNATFIIVSRMLGQIPHPAAARLPEPLKNNGEKCWTHCGKVAGYCAWCGVGNACCGNEDERDPLECKGTRHTQHFHTCVAPNTDRTPARVINKGKDCYTPCGKVGGQCNFCGAGNVCCRQGVADARECVGATGFTTDLHHECVAPAVYVEVPPPTKKNIGCAVIVRGSHNKQNNMLNADFMLTSLPFAQCNDCKVHAGFNGVWRNVHAKVVQTLGSLGCLPGSAHSRVLLTGESFGGGVATIGQYYLQGTGYTMEMQYNFGSPRVGDSIWAEHFNTWFDRDVPLFRITHAHDVVSRLPPTRFLNYRHVNSEVFYPAENANEYVVCIGGEAYECQNRFDLAECVSLNVGVFDSHGSLKGTPGEAFDADHCHSGLAPDGDMCQCTLNGWWRWYRSTDFIKHRWDSAPNNTGAPRLAPGVTVG